MKNTDFQKVLHKLVREEVKKYVGILLPIVVSEVIDYKLGKLNETKITKTSPSRRNAVNEAVGNLDEEWKTLGNKTFNSSNLSELLGYGDMKRIGEVDLPITPDKPSVPRTLSAVTEHGTEIPIPTEKLPEKLVNDLTKDYGPLMAALKMKKS